jgi:hypothetical protein
MDQVDQVVQLYLQISANSGKLMNSENLKNNISFNKIDRDYMHDHLYKFHSTELSNTNI